MKTKVISLEDGIELTMVLIPEGKFNMGSTKEVVKAALKDDGFFKQIMKGKEESEVANIIEGLVEVERPHEVTISNSFYMGKYEVTNEQWDSIMLVNRSDKKEANLPVTNVAWFDCQEFIKKLNEKTKGGYRLPTEAEWEYSCRAGTTTMYSFGDDITPKDANWNHNFISILETRNQYQQGKLKPVAVGSYNPNLFGLYDMHGNIWEWCEDWYGAYPKGSVTDPKGPISEGNRVLRGGSFNSVARYTRSAARNIFSPDTRLFFNGFRLARTL